MPAVSSPLMDEKRQVRKLVLGRRAALSAEEHALKSDRITAKILSLPEYQKAKTVMLFLNFRDEVETTGLALESLALKKKLILPRCGPQGILIPAIVRDMEQDIEPGMWGIREPKKDALVEADPAEIDFVLVPGAAFDMSGNRLGYGAGYYDRFFKRLRLGVPRMAVAFSCQILPQLPVEEHDQKMTALVTEDAVHRF
ncbi:MAG: 5-formyltetrahydrofolate cyclo-ligase [Desulfitobacteriaceae bacterium]